jgi:UDPglucose--hexose-1-phosphate uridylyltransferase
VIEAWTDRTAELSALHGVEQIFCFENRGQEIGVTLDHPHGQIYAYPFVTPWTTRMLRAARAHRTRTARNLSDDVLAAERAYGTRIVASTPEWTAFVPFAARWPYEVHIYPHTRVADLTQLSGRARRELAGIYLDVLRRFDRLFDQRIPYISAVHQAPVREGRLQQRSRAGNSRATPAGERAMTAITQRGCTRWQAPGRVNLAGHPADSAVGPKP